MVTRSRITAPGEVVINNVYFKLAPGEDNKYRVGQFAGNTLPEKVTLGDYNADSNPIVSPWDAVGDQRDGIGIDRMDIRKDLNRCWISDCNLQYNGHLVLPPLITPMTGEPTVQFRGHANFAELNSAVYGAFGGPSEVQTVRLLTTNAWGLALVTFTTSSAGITDIATGSIAGTVTLVACNGIETRWTTDGTTWSGADATDISYIAFFNDMIWGVGSTGQLYYTNALASGWTQDTAKLPLQTSWVQGLFVANDAENEKLLYASTQVGLYAHDSANGTFVKTEMEVPFHPSAGKGIAVRSGSIYFSSGLAVYKYTPRDGSIIPMGLDQDDGLDASFNGVIQGLAVSNNELLALVTYTPPAATTTYASLFGYNGRGWQKKNSISQASETSTVGSAPFVSYAASTYRVYWGFYGTVTGIQTQHMPLEVGIVNPTQVTTTTYMSGAHVHETSWYGGTHQTQTALKVHVETTNPTASETVLVEYATDYVESYTTLGTITATGDTHYQFASGVGVVFRAIKFRLTLTRGATTTNTPDVIRLSLIFMKTNENLRAFTVDIDFSQECHGKSPKELREALDTIVATKTMMDFSFRDETDNSENAFVTLRNHKFNVTQGYSNEGRFFGAFSEAVAPT